jgi:hypothetical protein
LRLRFEERDLVLLRGAEQARGTALAHQSRADVLRTALALSKAGHKLRQAAPGASVSFDEPELHLLLDAVRFAHDEVQQAASQREPEPESRRAAVLVAFPELLERGLWRSFGLTRELEELAQRLESALRSM